MTYEKWKQMISDARIARKLSNGITPKSVDIGGGSGIIKEKGRLAVKDVHYVGKIDIAKYRCVTPDIQTDEVIITEERIKHIKDRHLWDFDKLKPFLVEILQNPDYILEDSKNKNTGLILKEISENNNKFQMVLRLHTSSDEKGYKNSVISAWEISQSRWDNYLRNKKILYKSE